MSVESRNERIAILLKSLGGSVTTNVIEQLTPQGASSMTTAIARLEETPPTDDEINDVLEEFNRFMEFALANSEELAVDEEVGDNERAAILEFVSSGDPFADLMKLEDYQLAGALRSETGPAIAVILSQLSDERAGTIMALLPEDVKQPAFLRLQSMSPMPQPLLKRIIQATVDRASLLDQTAAADPDHVADEKTASLLRAMDRATRGEMLAALENDKPDVAERVKGLLFVFDDLMRITDKSIQKMLGGVDKSELAIALKNADPELVDRVTSNISKRAKAGLLEEIEYLEGLSPEMEREARKKVCDVLAKLDQSGDLEMMP